MVKRKKEKNRPTLQGHRLMEVRAVAGIFKHSWLVLCECGYTEHNLPTANMARGLHDIHLLNVMEGNYITANA